MNTKSQAAQRPQVRAILKEMRELRDGSSRQPRARDGQWLYDTTREAFLKAFGAARIEL